MEQKWHFLAQKDNVHALRAPSSHQPYSDGRKINHDRSSVVPTPNATESRHSDWYFHLATRIDTLLRNFCAKKMACYELCKMSISFFFHLLLFNFFSMHNLFKYPYYFFKNNIFPPLNYFIIFFKSLFKLTFYKNPFIRISKYFFNCILKFNFLLFSINPTYMTRKTIVFFSKTWMRDFISPETYLLKLFFLTIFHHRYV